METESSHGFGHAGDVWGVLGIGVVLRAVVGSFLMHSNRQNCHSSCTNVFTAFLDPGFGHRGDACVSGGFFSTWRVRSSTTSTVDRLLHFLDRRGERRRSATASHTCSDGNVPWFILPGIHLSCWFGTGAWSSLCNLSSFQPPSSPHLQLSHSTAPGSTRISLLPLDQPSGSLPSVHPYQSPTRISDH